MLNTLTGVHYLVYYPPITCDRLSSYSEIPSLFVDRFFIFFSQDAATERKEANAVFCHSCMKANRCIRVSEIITTNHGVQRLIITTETSFGTIAKVQNDVLTITRQSISHSESEPSTQ